MQELIWKMDFPAAAYAREVNKYWILPGVNHYIRNGVVYTGLAVLSVVMTKQGSPVRARVLRKKSKGRCYRKRISILMAVFIFCIATSIHKYSNCSLCILDQWLLSRHRVCLIEIWLALVQ